jgi:hypothetical protein
MAGLKQRAWLNQKNVKKAAQKNGFFFGGGLFTNFF